MQLWQRLRVLYRRVGRIERLFLLLLALYLVLLFVAPTSGLRYVLQVLVALCLVAVILRLFRAGVRKAIWRLRNRLLVTYVFIGVVPVVLIVLLLSMAAWMLTGQIAVYMVTTEFDRQASALLESARSLTRAVPGTQTNRAGRMPPSLAERYPEMEVLVKDLSEWRYPDGSRLQSPPAGWGTTSGILLKGEDLYLWARSVRDRVEATLMVPLNENLLASLVPNLGEVSVLKLSAAPGNFNLSEPTQASQRAPAALVPAPTSFFDVAVTWFSVVSVAAWDSPEKHFDGLLGVRTRPSAVFRKVFGQRVELASGILWAFVFVGALFLSVELISLFVGVSLTRTITGAVHKLYRGTQKVMQGDFSHRIETRGDDQLARLSNSFNRMTENLQRLVTAETERQKMQSDLEIAREVQDQLFPRHLPALRTLQLGGACEPARLVSGDYYDCQVIMDSTLALSLGDVAGKGISAALLMATLQSAVRTQMKACLDKLATTAQHTPNPISTARLVSELNQHVYAFTAPEKYSTFFLGIYNDSSSTLTYTNAGHLPPILLRGGNPTRLDISGAVVGALPCSEYGESSIELLSGDLLIWYTDGITEPENEYGEMFGEGRLIEVVSRNASRDIEEIIAAVLESVRQWTASTESVDDMTLLLARRI